MIIRRFASLLLIGTLALTVAPLSVTPVHAAQRVILDDLDDVQYYDWVLDDTYYDYAWPVDIDGLKVGYNRATTLKVTIRMVEMQSDAWTDAFADIDVNRDGATDYYIYVDADGAFVFEDLRGDNDPIVCNARFRESEFDDTIVLIAPSSCLGRPRAVRVRADVSYYFGDSPDCCFNYYWDDTVWSPRVRG